jgi:hypothetical protein
MSGEDRTDLDVAAILGAHTRRFAPGGLHRRSRRRGGGWMLTAVLLAVLATPELIHLANRAPPAPARPGPRPSIATATGTAARSVPAAATPVAPPPETAYVFGPAQAPPKALRPDATHQVATDQFATDQFATGAPHRPTRRPAPSLRGRPEYRLARAARGRVWRRGDASLTETLNRTRYGDSGAMSDLTVTDSLNRMEARRARDESSWGGWRRPAYSDEPLPERRQMALRRRIQREQRTEAWDDISLLRQR